jgi:hypothetical protein
MRTMTKDYCVKGAFASIRRVSANRAANNNNTTNRKIVDFKLGKTADRLLKERLESFHKEAEKNRLERERKDQEYDKTRRLLNLMNGNKIKKDS